MIAYLQSLGGTPTVTLQLEGLAARRDRRRAGRRKRSAAGADAQPPAAPASSRRRRVAPATASWSAPRAGDACSRPDFLRWPVAAGGAGRVRAPPLRRRAPLLRGPRLVGGALRRSCASAS